MQHQEVAQFLPDTGKERRFDKDWLATVSLTLSLTRLLQVVNTLNPSFFPENIATAMELRRLKHQDKEDDFIEMTPAFQRFFETSK